MLPHGESRTRLSAQNSEQFLLTSIIWYTRCSLALLSTDLLKLKFRRCRNSLPDMVVQTTHRLNEQLRPLPRLLPSLANSENQPLRTCLDLPNVGDPIDWDSQGNGNSTGDRVIRLRPVPGH